VEMEVTASIGKVDEIFSADNSVMRLRSRIPRYLEIFQKMTRDISSRHHQRLASLGLLYRAEHYLGVFSCSQAFRMKNLARTL